MTLGLPVGPTCTSSYTVPDQYTLLIVAYGIHRVSYQGVTTPHLVWIWYTSTNILLFHSFHPKFKKKKPSTRAATAQQQQQTKSFFSPLGTPTPLGSMAFDTNLDSRNMYAEDQNQTDELRQMDYHLREMEQFEQQKLEQSVEVSVIVCFFSFLHLACFLFIFHFLSPLSIFILLVV